MAKKSSKSFFTFAERARKAAAEGMASVGWLKVLKTFSVICVFIAICVGFWLLDRYRRQVQPTESSMAPLKLVEPPAWLNQDLKLKIRYTAIPKGTSLNLDEKSADIVASRLSTLVWMSNVRVETTIKGILISADYREPVALIEIPASRGTEKYYLSPDMIVLDYLPMSGLPIVTITGIAAATPPVVGQKWDREDAAAAVSILDKLRGMDRDVVHRGYPPLLPEIKSIDVANLDGRRDPKLPHIVLKAADDTQIVWGARLGDASRYMEANDYEKLAVLYEFYLKPAATKQKPTLQGRQVKYIELRIPRNSIPRPTVPVDSIQN
jgi:hypothetical protein